MVEEHTVPTPTANEQFANLVSRFRLIEDRQGNLQRKAHLLEENLLSSQRDIKVELKVLHSELSDLKRSIAEFDEFKSRIAETLENLASREEVKLIERYVNLLDPTNFISRKHLEHEIERAVESRLRAINERAN